MIRHDLSLYFALLIFTFFTPELDPLAWRLLTYVGIAPVTPVPASETMGVYASWLYAAKVIMTASIFIMLFATRGVYRFFFKKPLTNVSRVIKALTLKYQGIEADPTPLDEKDLKTILAEIRSVFCKFYHTNEISLTLFEVQRSSGLVAKSYLHVNEDGFVDKAHVPSVFPSGQGFCGIALKDNNQKFGRKTIWLGLRKNPEYLDIGIRNDANAYSFWCLPIHSGGNGKQHIVYVLAIETSRMKYFDLFAQRDGSNREIYHNLDNLIGNVYNCIHNEK
jgi:hypothetical protein